MSNNRSIDCVRETNGWVLPALVSGLLHGVAVLALWGSWGQESPANTPPLRLQTQLMTLTYEMAEPEPLPLESPPVVETEPVPDQALIARQRLQEQQQREQQEREREVREQQEKERQERLVREQERQQKIRADQLAEEKLAEEKLAEEKRQQHQQEQYQQEQQRLAAEAAAIAQYQPIYKAPPDYPRRALDSNIEGDCTVSYTVTPDGRVTKPKVLESACDDQIFIRPSLQAASTFRYQPRVINGRAVAVHDVRNTFRYRIQP